MKQVTVSVVTICLNHSHGLEQTLRSIDTQTWTPINCFVIDGGSTDGSLEILQQRAHLGNFTFLSEPDGGIFDAMNKGWKIADGDLVVFMNAGDCFTSNSIVEIMARSYAFESWRWGYGRAQIQSPSKGATKVLVFEPFRFSRLALGISTIPHQATVMQRSLLDELGGFETDAGLAADQKLLFRAALISHPRIWKDAFANYEGGGVSSGRIVAAHVLDMARYRRQSGVTVGGGLIRDAVVTAALFASELVVAFCKLVKLLLTGRGRDIQKIFESR